MLLIVLNYGELPRGAKTAALKYDAASELWYESVHDFKRARNSEAALRTDKAKFTI